MNEMALPSSPVADFTLEGLLSQSPNGMRPRNVENPSCCCGQVSCAYLEHNNAALEGLEKDLRNAAQIGQVSHIHTDLHFCAHALFCFLWAYQWRR